MSDYLNKEYEKRKNLKTQSRLTKQDLFMRVCMFVVHRVQSPNVYSLLVLTTVPQHSVTKRKVHPATHRAHTT
ncbi:hypothetical protein EB796_008030 [Bugula neritina]|uniref:Uncharacterized protein n=1 Tax=Bugula neritina TaxID=10212 RepID=A0A7J7K7R6_BUGNE|nr:hypothetical protein EB796_008030 [Bugula neritina]